MLYSKSRLNEEITFITSSLIIINRLSVIWKSDLTDKMKHSFFQAAVVSILLNYMDANETDAEKA